MINKEDSISNLITELTGELLFAEANKIKSTAELRALLQSLINEAVEDRYIFEDEVLETFDSNSQKRELEQVINKEDSTIVLVIKIMNELRWSLLHNKEIRAIANKDEDRYWSAYKLWDLIVDSLYLIE